MAKEGPTQILRAEHKKVLETLGELEKSLAAKSMKAVGEGIKLLEKEFEKHSLQKEEKALFPEIEKFLPRDSGPTGVMVLEHRQLVESIKNFENAIKAKDFKKLDEIESGISSILRPHIDKENDILFMMADMHLDEGQKEAVLEKFKEIDSK